MARKGWSLSPPWWWMKAGWPWLGRSLPYVRQSRQDKVRRLALSKHRLYHSWWYYRCSRCHGYCHMGWCGERQRYLPILRSQKARAARQKASSKVVQKMIYAEQARKRIKFRGKGQEAEGGQQQPPMGKFRREGQADAEADAKLLCLGNA